MPVVYANVIDVVGKMLYTGDIVWLREYIQNAIDSSANEVKISVEGRDIRIRDNGIGMDLQEIDTHLFSVGGSVKSSDQIGQFGIGMYAGSGICEKIIVRTKKTGHPSYQVELDMKLYNEIVKKDPMTLFEDVVNRVFSISIEENNVKDEHFSEIRFENVEPSTIRKFTSNGGSKVESVVANSVTVPMADSFPFKSEIENFLGQSYVIRVYLIIEGSEPFIILRYLDMNRKFIRPMILRDIRDSRDGKILAKLWAVYPEDGKTLGKDAGLLVRYKGLTVGDSNVTGSRFNSKDSRRFLGEIVILDESLQLNTERSWFLPSSKLEEFENQTKLILGELHGLANFDSKFANGLLNKTNRLVELKEQYSEQERIGNKYNAKKIESSINDVQKQIVSIEEKLDSQLPSLEKESTKGNVLSVVKLKLAKKTVGRTEEIQPIKQIPITNGHEQVSQWNSNKYIRTLLENYVIDLQLRENVAHKNSKDTLTNLFTQIETTLKVKSDMDPRKHIEMNELLDNFVNTNKPPDYISLDEYANFYPAFKEFVRSSFTLFRNDAVHTFISHFDNDRNNLQFLMFGDLLLGLINSWEKN